MIDNVVPLARRHCSGRKLKKKTIMFSIKTRQRCKKKVPRPTGTSHRRRCNGPGGRKLKIIT